MDKRYNFYHLQKRVRRQWLTVLVAIVVLTYISQPVQTPVSPSPCGGCILPTVTKIQAVEPIVEPPKPKIPTNPHQGAVDQYAKQYGVDPDFMNCILFKESSFNPSARNKHSSATGMAQFIKSTWTSFRTRMGEDTNLDLRLDARESIKTLAWALSKGYKNHWQVVTNGSCKAQ